MRAFVPVLLSLAALVLAAPAAADEAVAVSIAVPPPPPLPPHPHRRPPCPWHPPHPLAVPDAPRGRLTLVTQPFAEVTIDGRVVGHTPLVGFWLDPGRHRVVVRAACGTVRRTLDVTPSTDVRLSLALCGRPATALR